MKSYIGKFLAGLCTAVILVGCGGEDRSSSSDTDTVQISGAGIKGPLAFADVKIFALDPTFPDYYDNTLPVSVAITNQYAEINGLSVPRKIKPPYILVINGSNGIDLNTGVAPVIDTLVTVITKDMLDNNRPIFATPLTTLVFHMARLSTVITERMKRGTIIKAFVENINNATSIASNTFMIGQDRGIDLFRSPLIINENTTDLAEQEKAVYHRATVESFAANVYALAQQGDLSSDAIIESLALDIHTDGVIDNSDNGALISSAPPIVFSQAPMKLLIPNTSYQISEIMLLMEDERALLGTDREPAFLRDEIAFPESTASTNADTVISDTKLSDPLLSDTPFSDSTLSETTITESSDKEKIALPAPVITFSVASINFGSQYAGLTGDLVELVLTNSGTAPLNILGISVPTDFIETNNCSDSVPAGGNCIFDIQFVPSTTGEIIGKLVIASDAENSSVFVSLSGTGISIADEQTFAELPFINPDSPDILFYNDLNNEIKHTYTHTDLQDFWGFTGKKDLYNAVNIVADPGPDGTHNNAMRVFYAADVVGRKGISGTHWPIRFSSHDELYFSYDVFFERNAEFVKGGKLPRLESTGWEGKPGVPADGTDRWSAGLMWKENGKLASYVYHANMSGKYGDVRYWDDGADGQAYFQPGQWHSVEVRVVINTPGVLDGRMQGWFDGKLAFDTNEFMWRMPGGEHLDIGEFMFTTFYGGSNSSWAPSTDQHIYFDNFVLSTAPITH